MTISGSPWTWKLQQLGAGGGGGRAAGEQLPTAESAPDPIATVPTVPTAGLEPYTLWMGKTLSAPALEGCGGDSRPDSGVDTASSSSSSSSSGSSGGRSPVVSALRPPPLEAEEAPLEDDGRHPLLQEREQGRARVDYSPAVVQRAFLTWAQLGHALDFKDVCNYFHVLHDLEETFSPEDRLWSRERDLELLQKSPPSSDFLEHVFPNLYPKKSPYVTYHGQVKRAIRKSSSLSPDPAPDGHGHGPAYCDSHQGSPEGLQPSRYELWGGYRQQQQQQPQQPSQYWCAAAGAGVYLPQPPQPPPQSQQRFKYTSIQYRRVYPVQRAYSSGVSIWDYSSDAASSAAPAGLARALGAGVPTAGTGVDAGKGAGTGLHSPLTYSSVLSSGGGGGGGGGGGLIDN